MYATFNLNGAETGVYDVALIKPNADMAMLTDGFTIEKGSGTGITGGISGTGLTCYIVNEGVEELLEAYVNAPTAFVSTRF